jgi:hypothetical protein
LASLERIDFSRSLLLQYAPAPIGSRADELPKLPVGFWIGGLENAGGPQLLGFLKKIVGLPHEHSLRQWIK